MATDNRLPSNARRDANTQLARRIGLGYAPPLNTLVVATEHVSGDPEDQNTLQRIYSKVSYNHAEHIYLHQPQAGVRYWLVDEESVDWNAQPNELQEALKQQFDHLRDQGDRHAQPSSYQHSPYQPTLTLTTPPVSGRDRNFVVVAEDLQRGLLAIQQTRITVKAGVDINLTVAARPAAEETHPWLTQQLVKIDYNTAIDAQITKAQAECLYQLVDTTKSPPEEVTEDNATREGYRHRSQPDVLGEDVRDALLTSQAFTENTHLQVYANFVSTINDGYLLQQITVMVRPNLALAISPDLTDTHARAQATDAPLVENPQEHPYTAYYGGTAGLTLQGSQQSSEYRIRLKNIDIAANEEVLGSSATDHLYPQIGQLWSAPTPGTNGPLTIPLTQPLQEDPTFEVQAIDREYGAWEQPAEGQPARAYWEAPLLLTETVKLHVYPDPRPSVHQDPEPPEGAPTVVLTNTQEGISYQLHHAETHAPIGDPVYHSKNKKINYARIGVSFSPNPFEGDQVRLVAHNLTATTTLYVKATKPTSGLTIRLTQTIQINV